MSRYLKEKRKKSRQITPQQLYEMYNFVITRTHEHMSINRPKVGVGIIIQNDKGEILIGKRKGSHAPYYSIPGGHLEMGETFETAAIKEVMEETGLVIKNPKVFCVTNNLKTYRKEGKHFVSVNLFTHRFEGIPKVMEPKKCAGWFWVNPNQLPQPHFDASEFAVACFLKGAFYMKGQDSV